MNDSHDPKRARAGLAAVETAVLAYLRRGK